MRIECEYQDGSFGSGTGFVYRVMPTSDPEDAVPLLITNKHVVEGAALGRIRFTLSKNGYLTGTYRDFTISDFPQHWAAHPDPNIDLCALPIAPYIKAINKDGFNPLLNTVGKETLPTSEELEDYGTLEPIVMVGYPQGLWDKSHNLPILRKGITATHPGTCFNGERVFVIDAGCFPGSSGSPVFLYNEFGYESRSRGVVIGESRTKLLGILYAGPQQGVDGKLEPVAIPTSTQGFSISIPMHLGYVIHSSAISDFDDGYREILLSQRRTQQGDAADGPTGHH